MTSDAQGWPVLQSMYEAALRIHDGAENLPHVSYEESSHLRVIVEYREKRKGVPTVLVTLLLKKMTHPYQDIRRHQAGMSGGFSGRKLDTEIVTPFLKAESFPSMSESGWLTRSLEQAHPYDLEYPGQITPKRLKAAFLHLLDHVEKEGSAKARDYMLHLLAGYIEARDKSTHLVLPRPVNLSIADVVDKVKSHFDTKVVGAARLPVLAIHSILSVLTRETERYRRCDLLPLESHTASDSKTRLIGDVNILDADGRLFEGYEIKHNIRVTTGLIMDAYHKLRNTPVQRYYMLTTFPHEDYDDFKPDIEHVAQGHGCQLIVNGVDRTLLYYLRLIGNTRSFIDAYVTHLENDAAINYSLKESWNQIISSS